MTHIVEDLLIETFLYVPSDTLLTTINNEEKTLSLLRKLPNSLEKYYFLWKKNNDEISIFRLLIFAAEEDCVELFTMFWNRINKNNRRRCIHVAAEYGSRNVLEYCLKGKGNDLAAEYAAKRGHRDIVNSMLKDNSCCINIHSVIASVAARNGHSLIVKDMLERGANDINRIASAAANGGHLDILALLKTNSYTMECQAANGILSSFNHPPPLSTRKRMIINATKNGHLGLIKQMEELFPIDWNLVASCASRREIFNYSLKKLGNSVDCNRIALSAARSGRLGIINTMIKMGANNFDEIAITGARKGRKNVVLELINRVNDIESLLDAVIWRGYKDIANMILDSHQINVDLDLVKKAIDSDLDDLVYRLLPFINDWRTATDYIDEWEAVSDYAVKVGRPDLARGIASL